MKFVMISRNDGWRASIDVRMSGKTPISIFGTFDSPTADATFPASFTFTGSFLNTDPTNLIPANERLLVGACIFLGANNQKESR